MMSITAKYVHSPKQIAAMIPAEPNRPVMMRCVKLLNFERGEITYEELSMVRGANVQITPDYFKVADRSVPLSEGFNGSLFSKNFL